MLNEYIGNAVGYVRCSTDMQDDSINQQKTAIIEWAKKNKVKILRWFEDEGKSGTTFNERPGFNSLKLAVENNPDFKYVLVYDESRWGRANDPRDNSYWKRHFESKGIRVIIINTQSSNGNDLASYLIEVIESAQASEYSKNLSRATLRGQKTNAVNGYSNGGTAPYGYKRVAINKNSGKYVRDLTPGLRSYDDEKVVFALGSPDEVKTVNRIFTLRFEGLGYRAIANTLNHNNVPCPKRGRWKNRDQKWSSNTINTILSNPTYAGLRIFNRHPQSHLSGRSKEVWINDKSEWIIKENAHPAIISKELFEMVNKSRKPYSRSNRFFLESPYLLSGLLVCKKCGFNFQGQTRRIRSKGEDKQKDIYKIHYYLDGGYNGKGKSVCSPNLIRKEEVENILVKHIVRTINNGDFIGKVEKTVESKLNSQSNHDSEIIELNKKLEKCNKALKNLVQLAGDGIDIKEVREELVSIKKEREFLEETLLALNNETFGDKDVSNLVSKVQLLISDFEKIFDESPVHIKKKLIRLFVDKIEFDPDTDSILYYLRNVPWVDDKLRARYDFGNATYKAELYTSIKPHYRPSNRATVN